MSDEKKREFSRDSISNTLLVAIGVSLVCSVLVSAAAVVLSALGVPYATVLDDYLATNALWDRGERVPAGWPAGVVEAIFTARPEYLAAGFAVIEADFGSFDAYLERQVGISPAEREALAAKLLVSG